MNTKILWILTCLFGFLALALYGDVAILVSFELGVLILGLSGLVIVVDHIGLKEKEKEKQMLERNGIK